MLLVRQKRFAEPMFGFVSVFDFNISF